MKYVVNNTKNDLIEINDLEDFIKDVARDFKLEDAYFSVVIVSDKEIKEINRDYRGLDEFTDVISFALEDDKTSLMSERVLGDIYISFDRAKAQALDYGHSLKRELSFLAIHGLLHLMGYDHETKEDEDIMFNLQREVLNKYEIKK